MIIIINGMYGTHISKVAQEISLALNKPTKAKVYVNNNGVDFKYTSTTVTDGTINNDAENATIFDTNAPINYNETISNSIKIEDLSDYFIKSYKFDIGLPDEVNPEFFHSDGSDAYRMDGKDYRPMSIARRVKAASKSQKHYVIAGHIGKYMIDQIIKYVGSDNVLVYNIIRQPAASHAAYTTIMEEVDEEKRYYDLYNSHLLSTLDYVTTVRYEDVVETTITVAGKKINILGDAQFRSGSPFLEVEPEGLESSIFYTTFSTQYTEIDLTKYLIETNLADLETQWSVNYGTTLPDFKFKAIESLGY